MNVIIDTNTIISSYLSPAGPPAGIRRMWRAGAFDLVVSEPILREYQDVLSRPKLTAIHKMTTREIDTAVAGFREYGILVTPTETLQVVPEDPDDDVFFEAAVAGEAAYIVTGDKRVQAVKSFRGIRVVTPAVFLALLSEEHP